MRSSIFITLICLFILTEGCNKTDADKLNTQLEKKQEGTTNISQGTNNVPGDYVSVEKTEGDVIPNFHWKDAAGNATDVITYTDKITLVNFWATWCGPCNLETPDLVEANALFEGKGVKFLGVSVDAGSSAKEDVQQFINKFKIPYQMIIDRDDELATAFGNVRGYPTTFLINKDRKILSSWVGIRSKDFFIAEIQKHLN